MAPAASFPDEVLEHVLNFVHAHRDRNAVSLVCKAWCRTEGWSRRCVFVGNCYAASPGTLTRRFPRLAALELKGRPRFSDFGMVPPAWGALLRPWVAALLEAEVPRLEALVLKRMTVTDADLRAVARGFPRFRSLRLTSCDGFSTDGVAEITRSCRHLTELDLHENAVQVRSGAWLTAFPPTHTSLESLSFATLPYTPTARDLHALEALVARSPNLRRLRVSRGVPLDQLRRLLLRCTPPGSLRDLGTGEYNQSLSWQRLHELQGALVRCGGIRSLGGLWDVAAGCVPTLYPVCLGLTSLDLSTVSLGTVDFSKLISYCVKLQQLLVQDDVGDRGLHAAATSCPDLRELRVLPTTNDGICTESGLLAIASYLPRLQKILYFCQQMTNAAMTRLARSCPDLTHFRLCILRFYARDADTHAPLDEGFGSICKLCKNLRRLSLSGFLTDRCFQYIGEHAQRLELLSVAFSGGSDLGMQHILSGCPSLRKLEVRDCPFGDEALLTGIDKYESMRALWMSACRVTRDGCQFLADKSPLLNVEVIADGGGGGAARGFVEKLYIYRTIAGRRTDAPPFVDTL